MDLNYVKKLVKLFSESAVDEIEIEEEGKKIRLVKNRAGVVAGHTTIPVSAVPAAHAGAPFVLPQAVEGTPAAVPPQQPSADTKKYHEIKSPIVGTFYRSPSPDAAPFVQIGSSVSAGTILCIIEAMKLMNEIESDAAGTIVKILVENGQPVEYGQVLFLVEPA